MPMSTEIEAAVELIAKAEVAIEKPDRLEESQAAAFEERLGRGSIRFRLGLATFSILALELALIRWISGQIRVFAYFANLVLLAAFLGMGLGVAIGRRRPFLVRASLPVLAILSAILAFSPELHLLHVNFPDPSIVLWGAENAVTLWAFVRGISLIAVLFALISFVFLLVSTPVGWLFERLPPLTAYSADLLGSLLGVIAMTGLAVANTNPAVWMLLVVIPLLWIAPGRAAFVSAFLVLLFAGISVRGAVFSPYNRLDLEPYHFHDRADRGQDWILSTNRDFSQQILDLSAEASRDSPERQPYQAVYELPFRLGKPRGRVLVVGAGTGNDVAAALRVGSSQVVAVEIDPRIARIGRRLHPEHPYDDPRTVVVINDARAYFEQHPEERFDVVAYGLLDSHSMFSSMSSLRLENYVYSAEGIRAGWSHLKEGGFLSICFSISPGNSFIAERLIGAIREATGLRPVVFPHGMNAGTTFVAGRNLDLRHLPSTVGRVIADAEADPRVRIPTDDWPFLYLRPGTTPWTYIAVLGVILLIAWLAISKVYGLKTPGAKSFDPALFLMGAAFLLLETRMVTALSLLFGSTWVVNASVFSGILLTAFLANLAATRLAEGKLLVFYAPLVATLLLTWAIPPGWLNSLPLLQRGIVGGILYALPVAFAGLIFSGLLRDAAQPATALGSNLLGAVVGGTLEYTSMAIGLRSLTLLALVFYLLSYLFVSRARAAKTT
jgi:SAM-dependent methyltransferase